MNPTDKQGKEVRVGSIVEPEQWKLPGVRRWGVVVSTTFSKSSISVVSQDIYGKRQQLVTRADRVTLIHR